MMQQVATRQSESAASNLPLDIASSANTKDAFNQVMSDESQKVSAFEFAKSSADNAAAKQHKRKESDQHSADLSVEQKTSSDKSREDTINNEALNSQAERANKSHDAQKTTKHPNNNEDENELKLDESAPLIPTELSEDSDALSLDVPLEQETFDYISYVTQLAEFTGNESDTTLTPSQNFLIELDAIDAKSNETSIEAISLLVPIDLESGQEFTKVSLSKQELQAILDAQDAQLDLNTTLSDEDVAKLQDIISSMLAQLQPSTDDTNTVQNSEHTKADQALLTSLLMSQDKNHTTAADKLDKANSQKVLSTMNASQLSAPPIDQTLDNSEHDAQAPLVNTDLVDESDETDGNIWRKTPELLVKSPANDAPWAKTPDTPVKQADTNKASLMNLAELSEEQANKAINSIAERVQSLASDVSSNAKGSEFVAAMQSGLKEFKQQLSSGRENQELI